MFYANSGTIAEAGKVGHAGGNSNGRGWTTGCGRVHPYDEVVRLGTDPYSIEPQVALSTRIQFL